MESLKNNELVQECSVASLIDWGSLEITENENKNNSTNNNQLFNNNPFDMMELKAANLDPFDLEPYQMKLENDPPCSNLLSPLWQPSSKKIRRSMSLTNIDCFPKNVEKNNNTIKADIVKDQIKTNTGVEHKEEISKQQKENSSTHNICKNKIQIQEEKIEFFFTLDSNKLEMENNVLSDEEKKQIREQTRKHIEMLIEKTNIISQEEREQQLVFCTPKRNEKFIPSRTSSLLNKAFINDSCNSLNNFSMNNESDNIIDLDSLKPEWFDDNFSESDGSTEVHTPNDKSVEMHGSINTNVNTNVEDQLDKKFKALYGIGTVEQKPIRCQTNLKCMQNKKVQNKGPFLANVPLQQMVQDHEVLKMKERSHKEPACSFSTIKPIACSTPTLKDIGAKIMSSSNESSIKLSDLSHQSMHSSVKSPNTSVNVIRSIEKMSINDKKKIVPLNNSSLTNSANKRSNSTIVLSNALREKRSSTLLKNFKLNHSKSESNIEKIPKLMTNTRLPVPKQFSMPGKENSQPL